jgi:hypothetical protein
MTFESAGLVQNHEQNLHVLRYSTRAWRLGEDTPFHEELGYWSFEPSTNQVMKSLLVPRGIALIAGGEVAVDAQEFTLTASCGAETFGICANPFLVKEFKIIAFDFTLKFIDSNTISYFEDTVLQLPGRKDPFHHTDKNVLKRIS